jgi:hypothetical protein
MYENLPIYINYHDEYTTYRINNMRDFKTKITLDGLDKYEYLEAPERCSSCRYLTYVNNGGVASHSCTNYDRCLRLKEVLTAYENPPKSK